MVVLEHLLFKLQWLIIDLRFNMIIRKSKILYIGWFGYYGISNTTVLDNAIDIDDDGDWVTGATGRYAANIRVQNCYIMSTGFYLYTCIRL